MTAIGYSIFTLIFRKAIAKISFQLVLLHVLAQTHVKAQHRIFRPVFLHCFNEETPKQVLSSLEIRLKCRYKQRLAEPSWTAQEDIAAEVYHAPDILSLVDIQHIVLSDFLKGLYAHWQSFQSFRFHILKNI